MKAVLRCYRAEPTAWAPPRGSGPVFSGESDPHAVSVTSISNDAAAVTPNRLRSEDTEKVTMSAAYVLAGTSCPLLPL